MCFLTVAGRKNIPIPAKNTLFLKYPLRKNIFEQWNNLYPDL